VRAVWAIRGARSHRHDALCLARVIAAPAAAHSQGVREWARTDRVVLYSPHFDLIPAPYGGLDCPSQPLRLYGFETSRTDAAAGARVRLFGASDPRFGKPPVIVPNEPVRLSRRWVDDHFVQLPDSPPWAVRTDSLGGALLRVPPGIYELLIVTGAPLGRGIIQVRLGRHDSVHVHTLSRAQC
jgi:hypothetical protein